MNKPRNSKIVRLGIIAAITASLLGCSGDDSSSGADAQAASTTAVATTVAPTSTTAVTVTLPKVPEPAAHTVDDLLALGRPIVLAHASGEYSHPHSSLYGFDQSARMGVDVLDMDVQLTKDGVLVIHHNLSTGSTANEDLVLLEHTYDELHALDSAYWFTKECTCTDKPEGDYIFRGVRTGDTAPPAGYAPDDFAINSVEDLMKRFPQFVLNIEIKDEAPQAFASADALIALLEKYDSFDRVVVTSFDDEVVSYFHDKAPTVAMTPGLDMATQFVLGGVNPPDWARIMQVPPEYEGIEVVNADYVAKTRAAGLVTWVWPNGGETIQMYRDLLALGVEGINAAIPRDALSALDEFLGNADS